MPDLNVPFPHADRRTLKAPPIELIIAQVRFPTLAELFANEGFIAFATAVRDQYPNASPESHFAVEITPERVRERNRTPVWRFEELSGKWTLTLTPDFLALEARQYQSFPEFRTKFQEAWRKLTDIYKIKHRTRLGLRYVDRFSTEKQTNLPADWMGLVEPTIFSMRTRDVSLPQSGGIEHRFLVPNNLALTLRAKFRTGGFDGILADEFVLDLDAFDPTTTEPDQMETRLDDLKELTHNAFWWTFGRLLDHLEPVDAAR